MGREPIGLDILASDDSTGFGSITGEHPTLPASNPRWRPGHRRPCPRRPIALYGARAWAAALAVAGAAMLGAVSAAPDWRPVDAWSGPASLLASALALMNTGIVLLWLLTKREKGPTRAD
jgi:hypothetical protein